MHRPLQLVMRMKVRLGCALTLPVGHEIESEAVFFTVNSDSWLTIPFSNCLVKETCERVFCCFRHFALNLKKQQRFFNLNANDETLCLKVFCVDRSLATFVWTPRQPSTATTTSDLSLRR